MTALQDVRQQTLQNKQMQVECQRQQRRQQRLRKELEQARRDQARQDVNAMKWAELQEEVQNVEAAIAAAECEELSAVSRLQNSQSVRAEAISQLQASRCGGAASSSEASSPAPLSPAPFSPEQVEAFATSAGSTGVSGTASPVRGAGGATSPDAVGRASHLAGARSGCRSSPRLLGGSPPHSPQQASPPPACTGRQPPKLGGSRSAGNITPWTPGRPGLGQITEEEESPVSPKRSPVEVAVEEFRKQVESFQAQSQHFQSTAEATTQRLHAATAWRASPCATVPSHGSALGGSGGAGTPPPMPRGHRGADGCVYSSLSPGA